MGPAMWLPSNIAQYLPDVSSPLTSGTITIMTANHMSAGVLTLITSGDGSLLMLNVMHNNVLSLSTVYHSYNDNASDS